MRKVAIIGTAGVPARYGGFETLVHHLVNQLSLEFDLYVYCSNKYYPKAERKKYWKGARLFHLPLNANGASSILYDILSILHALFYADTLLVLGVSGGIILPLVKLFTSKKIIINIDGLEWRRQKWSKPIQKFLKISEFLAVKFSDADITDNIAIKKYTAINYKTLSHLIEYGADHVMSTQPTNEDLEKYDFLKRPYAFKVCRIEPENNVHVILEAFHKHSEMPIVVVGNWSASPYGEALFLDYSNSQNIVLLDPIYDQRELDLLRGNCQLYIHGHSAGGTNPSLVEAMYLGLPIFAYDVSYNRATTENIAVFFKDAVHLKSLLQQYTYKQRLVLGEQLKLIAMRRYTWEVIAQKYASLIYMFDYQYRKTSVWSKLSEVSYSKLISLGLAHQKHSQMFYEE